MLKQFKAEQEKANKENINILPILHVSREDFQPTMKQSLSISYEKFNEEEIKDCLSAALQIKQGAISEIESIMTEKKEDVLLWLEESKKRLIKGIPDLVLKMSASEFRDKYNWNIEEALEAQVSQKNSKKKSHALSQPKLRNSSSSVLVPGESKNSKEKSKIELSHLKEASKVTGRKQEDLDVFERLHKGSKRKYQSKRKVKRIKRTKEKKDNINV